MEFGKQGLENGWKEDTYEVLFYQGLSNILQVIRKKQIIRYHNNPLAGHFDIKKTRELIARNIIGQCL